MQKVQNQSLKSRRLKSNLHTNLKIKTKNLSFKSDDTSTQDSPVKKRLRKGSENLKSFSNIDLRRDQSIKETFQDCFELEHKIGEGGHSVVYKCKSLSDDKHYAVKVTRKNDPQNLQSLKQQYRILQSLKHESILKGHFLFVNQKKSTCHLVCQLYDCPNLREYFVEHKHQKFSEQKVGQIIKNILSAVLYMHEHKVSHRDLKPENILYDQITGQVKIIDFQVAKMPRYTHEKLQMWTKAGTPTYRSPQLLKGSYNQLTDLWSLGLITFEMLTGKFPFKLSYEHNTFDEILNKEPQWSQVEASESAKNFLMKLLKKDPKERMSAKEALSHPFILSIEAKTPSHQNQKKLNNSFQIDENGEENYTDQDNYSPKSKFYDQNVTFSFLLNVDKDIGIRFCQQ